MREKTQVEDFFDDVDEFEQLLDDAERQALTKWEQDYVAEAKERFEIYGKETYISITQLDKLREISQ